MFWDWLLDKIIHIVHSNSFAVRRLCHIGTLIKQYIEQISTLAALDSYTTTPILFIGNFLESQGHCAKY